MKITKAKNELRNLKGYIKKTSWLDFGEVKAIIKKIERIEECLGR